MFRYKYRNIENDASDRILKCFDYSENENHLDSNSFIVTTLLNVVIKYYTCYFLDIANETNYKSNNFNEHLKNTISYRDELLQHEKFTQLSYIHPVRIPTSIASAVTAFARTSGGVPAKVNGVNPEFGTTRRLQHFSRNCVLEAVNLGIRDSQRCIYVTEMTKKITKRYDFWNFYY